MAVTLVQNLGLDDTATSELTATVCEPTAAANGGQLFVTGNWFASSSANGGANWTLVNPFSRFPRPPAVSVATSGVGISAFYGGGTRHSGHVVGVKTATGWDTVLTRTSTHGPPDQSWGDYLSCIAHHPTGTNWAASGYTLQGGTSRRNIEPRFVQFRS